MTECEVLILGGGVAGLGCRAALAGVRNTMLLESEAETGGLLRMRRVDGFTFETTLHVLFFRDPLIREAVERILPHGLIGFVKENAVWQAGRCIRYPYQYHADDLPPAIRRQCLKAFHRATGHADPDSTFETWLLAQYGAGFYRHFFRPYNEKLYGVRLNELEAGPMLWTLPPGERDAVLGGEMSADRIPHPSTHCYYPRGPLGIAALRDALLALSTDAVRCGAEVVAIDPARRIVTLADGGRVSYRALASSLPLPVLLARMSGVPAAVAAAAAELRAAPVTTLQIGVREHGGALPAHWTYFPDPDVPFYRLVRLERISPLLAPAGGAALLLECPGGSPPDPEAALELLHRLGVLAAPRADVMASAHVPYAYVLFRKGYRRALQTIRSYLDSVGVESMGRYGQWMYSNIEGSLRSGLEAGGRLSGRTAEVLVASGVLDG